MIFDHPAIVIKIFLAVLLQPLLQVYGDKDTDGFYRGAIHGRSGLIPCNMVSEIQAEDEETMDQLMKQGFLPLNTPVDRIGSASSNIHSLTLSFADISIHSFIFSKFIILVKAVVDPKSILGTMVVRWEYTLFGTPVQHRAPCTNTLRRCFTPRSN